MLLVFLGVNDSLCFAQQQKVKAEEHIQADQSNVKVEKIPHQKLDDFRDDKSFDYFTKRNEMGIGDLIKKWFTDLLMKFLDNKVAMKFVSYFFDIVYIILIIIMLFLKKFKVAAFLSLSYIVYLLTHNILNGIAFFVIVVMIYKIVGGNLSGIFSSNKKVKGENGFDYFEEDIHQENIDHKLREAITNRNFRTAIRFYYLSLLKQLDANELIHWELGKTNRDYQRELKNQNFLDDFIRLSGIYEYSWYGHFEVNEEKFLRWQQGFRDVFQKVEFRT